MLMMNPKVDFYFEKAGKWQAEIEKLRTIILDCDLTEELKWGSPCYTVDDNNIVLIHTFKAYCAILFFKGAIMKDAEGLLIQQSKNVQAARQMRFTSLMQITEQEQSIKDYVKQGMAIEKAGLKVELKSTDDFAITAEFQQKLDSIPALKTAFEALTPGRQRAYLLHFSSPKQSKTREARVEKYMPQIMNGKGLND